VVFKHGFAGDESNNFGNLKSTKRCDRKPEEMRQLTLTAVSAAAILAAGFFLPNHAEALIAAPGSASLAAQAAAPIENVMWCGWRCHRFHHRAIFFHHRPVFAFHRFHHRPFFHRRWG